MKKGFKDEKGVPVVAGAVPAPWFLTKNFFKQKIDGIFAYNSWYF